MFGVNINKSPGAKTVARNTSTFVLTKLFVMVLIC